MKKIRIVSLILLLIAVILFGVYKVNEFRTRDNTPPVITCPTDTITASVSITEEELLEGVVARDDKSGNVTDTLVVEKISSFTEEHTRIITYAAIDDRHNVGRVQRTLVYTDYEAPRFTLKQPLRVPMGKSANLFSIVGATSVLDGYLSSKVKYSVNSTIEVGKTGAYEIEFRVTDSSGSVEYLKTILEVYDSSAEKLKVALTDYIIYLPVGAEFEPRDYYISDEDEDGAEEKHLTISEDVDTETPGVYYVTYTVEGEKSKGVSKLVVVVR
jgi:hypothetical protein